MGGFIRLMTHPRVLEYPMPITKATDCVQSWVNQSSVIVLEPGQNFPVIFFHFLKELGTAGNMTTEAHIAALAVEKQAEVHSCDADFSRFSGLNWKNPIA